MEGSIARGEDSLPTSPPLTLTAEALLGSVSCIWIPHQFYFGRKTMWLKKKTKQV